MSGSPQNIVSGAAPRDALEHGSVLAAHRIPQRSFQRHFLFVLHKRRYCGAGVRAWLSLCEREIRSQKSALGDATG